MSAAPLSLRLLGSLRIRRDGEDVRLPQSKKTRALLGYLVATGRPHSRSRLSSLLWDVADDPKAALRWSLSKLRPLLDDDSARRIVSSNGSVEFRAEGAYVDLYAVRKAVQQGLDEAPTEALIALADDFAGDLLEEAALPEFEEMQAWLVAEREEARRLQCEVLNAILGRLCDQPERALAYARHEVRLKPWAAIARARLVRLLAATDRRSEAKQQYDAGIDAIAAARGDDRPLREAWASIGGATPRTEAGRDLRQEIRFCTSRDGTRLAYATSGTGPPLVKTANWLSHLEHDWDSPVWRHVNRALSADHTYVRYDVRGCGLSDWDAREINHERFVEDLEAVVDAAHLDQFVLLGLSQGAAVAVSYAVRHPERIKALVLLGGFAVGWEQLAGEDAVRQREAMTTLMLTGWGQNNPAFRQIFTSLFLPEAKPDETAWFNELQRVSASPANAVRILEAVGTCDVRPLLSTLRIPTLVLHVKDDAVVPHARGRELAVGIPLARFVTLEGCNHLQLEDDPGWSRFLEEMRRFMSEVD